jgi:hypothetical protein
MYGEKKILLRQDKKGGGDAHARAMGDTIAAVYQGAGG